jgi:hypothetical protein
MGKFQLVLWNMWFNSENLIGYRFITVLSLYMDVISSSISDGSHKVERKMFVDDEVNTCSTRPTGSFPW